MAASKKYKFDSEVMPIIEMAIDLIDGAFSLGFENLSRAYIENEGKTPFATDAFIGMWYVTNKKSIFYDWKKNPPKDGEYKISSLTNESVTLESINSQAFPIEELKKAFVAVEPKAVSEVGIAVECLALISKYFREGDYKLTFAGDGRRVLLKYTNIFEPPIGSLIIAVNRIERKGG